MSSTTSTFQAVASDAFLYSGCSRYRTARSINPILPSTSSRPAPGGGPPLPRSRKPFPSPAAALIRAALALILADPSAAVAAPMLAKSAGWNVIVSGAPPSAVTISVAPAKSANGWAAELVNRAGDLPERLDDELSEPNPRIGAAVEAGSNCSDENASVTVDGLDLRTTLVTPPPPHAHTPNASLPTRTPL